MDIRIEVTATGPIFDGRADHEADAFLEQAKRDLGQQADADVHFWMNRYFRDPTPYYETQVFADNVGNDVVVHDRGIVYGPWLAGVGSRNATSRFKGYAHWRNSFQQLQAKAPDLLARTLRPFLERMR